MGDATRDPALHGSVGRWCVEMVVDRINGGINFLGMAELREEKMMDLVNMTEDEFRLYKQETLRRLSEIAHAEDHPYVAYAMADGCAELVDLESGKPMFCSGGRKEVYDT